MAEPEFTNEKRNPETAPSPEPAMQAAAPAEAAEPAGKPAPSEAPEYHCVNCGALLNEQTGFDPAMHDWICLQCSENNPISRDTEPHSYEEDERLRREKADAYFREKSRKRAELREENARRREKEKEDEARAAAAEAEEQEKKHAKRTAFFRLIKKHWRAALIILAALVLVVAITCVVVHIRKLTAVGYDSDTFSGMAYTEVVSELEAEGFTRISAVAVEDLSTDQLSQDETVAYVEIAGDTTFAADDRYTYDSRITVAYHTVINVPMPLSSKEAKKIGVTELQSRLEEAGFINITLEPDYDVVLGWFHDDGDVEAVTIDGSKKFKSGDEFRPDAEIIITYHTLKKNKPD